jgi:hypothetical protein
VRVNGTIEVRFGRYSFRCEHFFGKLLYRNDHGRFVPVERVFHPTDHAGRRGNQALPQPSGAYVTIPFRKFFLEQPCQFGTFQLSRMTLLNCCCVSRELNAPLYSRSVHAFRASAPRARRKEPLRHQLEKLVWVPRCIRVEPELPECLAKGILRWRGRASWRLAEHGTPQHREQEARGKHPAVWTDAAAGRPAPRLIYSSTNPASSFRRAQRHHVFLWIDDAIDLCGQGFEGPLLLRMVSMAIINAAHTDQDVPEAQLSVIRTHACPAHE